MSDTPETDAMSSTMFPDGSRWVHIEDCRKLERDRNEWREKAEHRSVYLVTANDGLESFKREADDLLDALERISALADDDECVYATMDSIRAIAHNALNHHYSEQEES